MLSRFNWGFENVHFWKRNFSDPNGEARILKLIKKF